MLQMHMLSLQLLIFLSRLTDAAPLISPCVQLIYGHSWSQGQDGQATITFPEEVTGWELRLVFDQPIRDLQFYHGEVSKQDDRHFIIRHRNYNEHVEAGGAVSSGWQASFSNLENVRIVEAELVGGDCSSVPVTTTTSDMTTSTTTTTTIGSTTTTEMEGDECIKYSHGHFWPNGQDGQMVIIFPENVNNWEITIAFDKPLTGFSFYHGVVIKVNATTYTIKNQNWNGVQSVGSVGTSGWQALFEANTIPAHMISATFVGISCGTTTTNDSVSTSPTTESSTTAPTTITETEPSTSTAVPTETTEITCSSERPTTTTTTEEETTPIETTTETPTTKTTESTTSTSELTTSAAETTPIETTTETPTTKTTES